MTQYLEDKEINTLLVKEECLVIINSTEFDGSRPLETPEVEENSNETLAPPACKKKKGLSVILKHIEEENMQNIPAFTPEDKIDNKITSYLD